MMRSKLRLCGIAPILERARRVRRPVQMSADAELDEDMDTAFELRGGCARARTLRNGRRLKVTGQMYMHALYVLA